MTFGNELKDQVPTIIDHVGEGIQFMNQLRNFFREKSNIEREYAQKLENLTRKYKTQHRKQFEGQQQTDTDEWEWEDNSSTCTASWLYLLNQTSLLAKNKFSLSDELNNLIVESLKSITARKEDAKKKHALFYQKIKSEREKIYIDKDKAKQLYDEACSEIENIKLKLKNKPSDQEKLQRQLDATILDRDNKKNMYLLAIAVANAEGSKYFEEDIPALSDHLEELDASRIIAMKTILKNYIALELKSLDTSKKYHDDAIDKFEKIDPTIDANLFVRQVLSQHEQKSDPIKVRFMPWNGGINASKIVIDRDDSLVTSDSAIIFLNNKLIKDRKQLDILGDELSTKANELSTLQQTVKAIDNKASTDYDKSIEKLMNVYRDITMLSTHKVRVKSEVDLIIMHIGDDGLRSQSHDFKQNSFTIPTSCDYCKSTIWGISNRGLTCRACGFNCHARCEMKVAQNCSKKKGQINPQPASSSLRIKSTASSVVSKSNASSPVQKSNTSSTISKSNASSPVSTVAQELPDLRSIYSYVAQNEDELNLNEGDLLVVVEPDDGTGWIKARLDDQVGLVPANYVEYLKDQNQSDYDTLQSEYDAQQYDNDVLQYDNDAQLSDYDSQQQDYEQQNSDEQDSHKYEQQEEVVEDSSNITETVVVLYDFEAVHPEELNLHEGDVIIVTKKDDSGWWEGTLNGQFGIFPSNYVSLQK